MAVSAAVNNGRSKLRRWWNLWVVGGVDHDVILRQIAGESGWSGRYAFLIFVSAALSLLGLLMPSVAVLIGAMLLSPLMMPIIGLGFGIATLDFQEIRRTATALALGSAIAILLSVAMVAISPIQTITSEIAGRTQPTLFDLLVALLSAVAGAYALIRGRGGTVVGVAIAIALMPPLAVVGFGLATWNWTVFSGSLLLFLTNAVTIALTAALVARVYGFGSHLAPRHTGWQLALFVIALGLLSVPLGTGLKQIAFEAGAQRQIREALRTHFPSDARLGQLDVDYSADPIRVRAVMFTTRLDQQPDHRLGAIIGQRLGRPVDFHVDQLRIGPDASAAEAAQIARASDSSSSQSRGGERAVNELALISGQDPSLIHTDIASRTLRASAARLPGLGMEGYRALEARADRVVAEWNVILSPPDDVEMPAVPIEGGVIDPVALDVAAWGAKRLSRAIVVDGGTLAQREAVARGISARGGEAEPGSAGGALHLQWKEVTTGPVDASGAPPSTPESRAKD